MEKNAVTKRLKPLFKVLVSLGAIYFVSRNIDVSQVKTVVVSAKLPFLVLAFVFFNLSQVASAYRLMLLINLLKRGIDFGYHLKLYYLGMFYNLVLPGGIGGDAYKVYHFRKNFGLRSRYILKALFLDRLSGLTALVTLVMIMMFALVMFGWANLTHYFSWSVVLIIPLYIVFFKAMGRWFRQFVSVFSKMNFFAFAVQLLQVLSVVAILLSLSIPVQVTYVIIFLVSSIAMVLPITVGGLGLREIVFMFGATYLSIQQEAAVAVGLVFFFISSFASLPGLFFLSMKGNEEVALKTNKVGTRG